MDSTSSSSSCWDSVSFDFSSSPSPSLDSDWFFLPDFLADFLGDLDSSDSESSEPDSLDDYFFLDFLAVEFPFLGWGFFFGVFLGVEESLPDPLEESDEEL